MNYYVFNNHEDLPWEIVYCNNHTEKPETPREVLESCHEDYLGIFDPSEHIRLNANTLSREVYHFTHYGDFKIYQVRDLVDRDGFRVPNAYQIRQVGIAFRDSGFERVR